jgi:hypothetical protein
MTVYDDNMSSKPSSSKKINPFDKRNVKNSKKAMNKTQKSVNSVAKDTNATRRKNTLLPLKNSVAKKTAYSKGRIEKKGIR